MYVPPSPLPSEKYLDGEYFGICTLLVPVLEHQTNMWTAIVKMLFENVCASQARIQEFTLVGAPWIGEGSGDRQGPQRVQGSARWGALGGEAPRKLMRIRNLRR